jgi:predicted RNase H-like HicB family nuclease
MGPGMGGGKGRHYNLNKDNTWGYQMMTPEERTAHRDKMHAAKTYDECKALQDEHHKAMEARAKEQGKTLPAPRNNGCDRMKAGGYFK